MKLSSLRFPRARAGGKCSQTATPFRSRQTEKARDKRPPRSFPSQLGRDSPYLFAKRSQLLTKPRVIGGKTSENLSGTLKALSKLREIGFGFGDRGHASAPYYLQQNGETHILFAQTPN